MISWDPTSPFCELYIDEPRLGDAAGCDRELVIEVVKAEGTGRLAPELWDGVACLDVLFRVLFNDVLELDLWSSSLPCAVPGRNEFRNS